MNLRFFCLLLLAAASIASRPMSASENPSHSEFASPSKASGPALFTRLSAERTGLVVENPYDDPQMWLKRYREFMGGGMGSGVAAGDFDGDGKVDLYVSTKTKPGRLYRNLGNWRFEDVTEAAGLSERGSLLDRLRSAVSSDETVIWRQGAVFADVNNNGLLDLYVCRNNAPNLLYINQGDGTFQEEGERRGLAIVDGSVIGAFADYDRDGWLDMALLTNQVDGTEAYGKPDRLFRNLGDGYFEETTQAAGLEDSTFGHAAVWFDYNGDLWPDLYIANDFAGSDHLYRNNGDGTFTNVIHDIVPHMPYSSMGADVADINNNGHFDLLVADMATTTREKDRRGLANSRGDVINSGKYEGIAPQYTRNALWLNTGLGIFAEGACMTGLHATDWTWSVRFEDFDNDGWVDLHVTNGMVREANNSDVLAQMMRALSDMQRIAVMKRSPELRESNLAYRNLGGDRFEEVTDDWGLHDVGITFGAATADFDNDGDLDLVYLDYNGGLAVYRNDVAGQNRIQVRLQGSRSNRYGIGAVVRAESASIGRQSRDMTVARGYASGSEIVAHFGLGSDQQVDRLTVEWPSGTRQEFTGLAANRAYNIAEPTAVSAPGGSVVASPAEPLFRFASDERGLAFDDESEIAFPDQDQRFIPFRTDRGGPGVAVGDVDGDGRDDLFLAATTGSPARMLLNSEGPYREAPLKLSSSAVEDGPPLLFDANGNGAPDLLITKASAKATAWPNAFAPVIYENDGHGGFAATSWLPKLALNVGAAVAADIDGNGTLDLFLGGRSVPGRYPETPQSVLLRNDKGRFVDITESSPDLGKVGLVKSALFRDVDQDGRVDLLLALEWDFVRYFRNEGDGRFIDRTEEAGFASGGRGWWNSLAAADLNGDGQLDFVAGNLGLNTIYRAAPERPATLFYGDFAQDGTKIIAEAEYDGDRLFPVRARADIGERLPFVLRAFPNNDAFAKADMEAVFGARPLQTARVYQADNFESGVFLSQADGTYRFEAFPRGAQLAPMLGLIAADLDGDGYADVLATQNSDIAVPRFHGGVGVFLKGGGDGSFKVLEPTQSGVLLPGNGRALVLLDSDNDARPDVFLTRHSGESAALTHLDEDDAWLRLALLGLPGNPSAAGAIVRLTFSDRSESLHETGIGGGWFSQSSPHLFVAQTEERRLVRAEVRWPDGQESSHTDAPEQGAWTLQHPDSP